MTRLAWVTFTLLPKVPAPMTALPVTTPSASSALARVGVTTALPPAMAIPSGSLPSTLDSPAPLPLGSPPTSAAAIHARNWRTGVPASPRSFLSRFPQLKPRAALPGPRPIFSPVHSSRPQLGRACLLRTSQLLRHLQHLRYAVPVSCGP